ncbi:MAG: ABC transporter ATP-binding protein [Nitrospira sp.]|nr:ABC transporter ATP-binding protein [Nitrospira sp.]MDR4465500.1 ABC transporter ATP-binding protein/permease [Nitrospira sp.]
MWHLIKRLQALLNTEERRLSYGLLGLIILAGFTDTIGVSSILPFMAVVGNPDLIQTNPSLHKLYVWLEFDSTHSFLLALGMGALVLMLLSNTVSLAGSTAILWFSSNLGHRLSTQILATYVKQPYTYFLERNTSNLVMNCTDDVMRTIQGIIIPLLQGIAKTIVAGSMLLLVMWVDPWLAVLSGAMIGIVYAIVFVVVRQKMSEVGRASKQANRERFRIAAEILHGIKELKILGRDEGYRGRFIRHSALYAANQWLSSAMSSISRYVIESIAFGSVIVLVLYLLATHQDFKDALPIMTLYALAAYRLLPAFQQIFGSATQVRFNMGSMEAVEEQLNIRDKVLDANLPSRSQREMDVRPLQEQIELRNLSFQYPNTAAPHINHLNLTIPRNTTVAIVGSTGAGKTTLIDIILGLLEPHNGALLVDGIRITSRNVTSWQKQLGYVPQHIYLADDTIAANIAFGVAPEDQDLDRVRHAAQIAHIHEFVLGELPDGYNTIVGERGVRLSGGQRQRIGIARALYSDPDILVLDEATNALDTITESIVTDAIREMSHTKTIIVIAHRLNTVQQADIIYMLENGCITDQGIYQELLATNERFREMAVSQG